MNSLIARRLALGTAQFGLSYGVNNSTGKPTDIDVRGIIDTAHTAGVRMLDTAPGYGDSEQRLGAVGVSDWQIVSKLPAVPDSPGEIASWVLNIIEQSCRSLSVSRLYAVLLHRPEDLFGAHRADLLAGLYAAKAAGLVEKVGVSIYEPQQLSQLVEIMQIEVVQAPMSIIDQRMLTSGWQSRLKAMGVEFHARSIFLQGLLLMTPSRRQQQFPRWTPLWNEWEHWLERTAMTPLAACVRFALSQVHADRIVIGVDTPKQMAEVLAIQECPFEVPPALSIDDASLLHPFQWRAT